MEKKLLNKIKQFYKLNAFKITFVILFSLFVGLFFYLSDFCNLNIGGTKSDYQCGQILKQFSIFWFYYVTILYVIQSSLILGEGTTILNHALAILLHIIISYHLACLLNKRFYWRKR